jgi:hypothetical protein
MTLRGLLVTAATTAILVGSSVQAVSAEGSYGTRERPLEGLRYETLRTLARQLDDSARGTLDGAELDHATSAGDGAPSAARSLPSIRSFARNVAAFRGSVDSYGMLPFEVPVRVDALIVRAQEMNDSVRSARVQAGTNGDWEAVLGILGRMRLLLAEPDAEKPSDLVAPLTGPRLLEFRQLARDVDVNATAAHATAQREVGDYDRGQQFLGELNYFATLSRDLRRQADAGQIHPQQMGPLVDRLLEDARQADRGMRDARVFTSVWVGSGSTITMLHRMAGLVRF